MVLEVPESPRLNELARENIDLWSRATSRRVDLYVPPPPGSDKQQALLYHLATRNFFATSFRINCRAISSSLW